MHVCRLDDEWELSVNNVMVFIDKDWLAITLTASAFTLDEMWVMQGSTLRLKSVCQNYVLGISVCVVSNCNATLQYTDARGLQFYGLQFISTYDFKPPWQYSPLTAMLICPVIMIFYIYLFWWYNLKMSKIGEQLTFPYKGFSNKDITGIPLM